MVHEFCEIKQNKGYYAARFKVIEGHRFWYQSKAHIRLPISDLLSCAVSAVFCRALTDRLTDHATRSVTIGGAHSGEAKFCYCLRL